MKERGEPTIAGRHPCGSQIDHEAYTQAMDYRLGEWRYAGPRGWQSAEVLVGSVRCTVLACGAVVAEGESAYRQRDTEGDFCACARCG